MDDRAATRQRWHLRVTGIVQGVGFRPFVHRLATGYGLGGVVGNDAAGVFVEVEGDPRSLARFVGALRDDAPPLASVEEVVTTTRPTQDERAFRIARSDGSGRRDVLVSPDVATCGACLAEVADPGDRRYRYPFANCTDCGPRYTIVQDVPYDRPSTTMAGFVLCADCEAEYHDPADRRFHAQPVCCPACGPQLRLFVRPPDDGSAHPGLGRDDLVGDEALAGAAALLRDGAVVAVKGLGGYHLAADATSVEAAEALRARKHREDKPFAVMVADLDAARQWCHLDDTEAALLSDPARPIVLVHRRDGGSAMPPAIAPAIAPAVAPGNRRLGLLLPYTPLHRLLLDAVGRPLVLTSGNVSDEPIAYRDDDARSRLAGIADAYLTHDRPIHIRVDDSVAHVVAGRPALLRRARGYVPRPVRISTPLPEPVLGVGAELKNTVCLARGQHAFVSHHIGDLENHETFVSFLEAIEHVGRLFDVTPEVVAHDLHPEYLSTKHALELGETQGRRLVGVQHHHAHIASCLVDNGRGAGDEPVIGLALDGLGYGTDGTLWGGEVLVADLAGFERVAHLAPVPMPGGAQAIREPWRMAAVHLDAAFDGSPPPGLAVAERHAQRWGAVVAMARQGINAPLTSSAGRLFDAVAALLGVRDTITYEGQAAIELEQLADPRHRGSYPLPVAEVADDGSLLLDSAPLVRAIVEDLTAGQERAIVAARFHQTVVDLLAGACARVREERGLGTVALSGGVFQNVLLLERLLAKLSDGLGFEVLTHRQVPTNDGGISLGQVVVAAHRER